MRLGVFHVICYILLLVDVVWYEVLGGWRLQLFDYSLVRLALLFYHKLGGRLGDRNRCQVKLTGGDGTMAESVSMRRSFSALQWKVHFNDIKENRINFEQ